MKADNLIAMANQIGSFFETMPDRHRAMFDFAAHLRRFWEPRMRQALLQALDGDGGPRLTPFALEAVRTHRSELL